MPSLQHTLSLVWFIQASSEIKTNMLHIQLQQQAPTEHLKWITSLTNVSTLTPAPAVTLHQA